MDKCRSTSLKRIDGEVRERQESRVCSRESSEEDAEETRIVSRVVRIVNLNLSDWGVGDGRVERRV